LNLLHDDLAEYYEASSKCSAATRLRYVHLLEKMTSYHLRWKLYLSFNAEYQFESCKFQFQSIGLV